jgi:hypothetical protein
MITLLTPATTNVGSTRPRSVLLRGTKPDGPRSGPSGLCLGRLPSSYLLAKPKACTFQETGWLPHPLVRHTPANTGGATLGPPDRAQDDKGTSQTGADDTTGYSIARVMLLSSLMMTVPIRQSDPRSAAGPRVTCCIRREPSVELSRARDQLNCSHSGLSRHNSFLAHTLRAADRPARVGNPTLCTCSTECIVRRRTSRSDAPETRLAARPVRQPFGNDINGRSSHNASRICDHECDPCSRLTRIRTRTIIQMSPTLKQIRRASRNGSCPPIRSLSHGAIPQLRMLIGTVAANHTARI